MKKLQKNKHYILLNLCDRLITIPWFNETMKLQEIFFKNRRSDRDIHVFDMSNVRIFKEIEKKKMGDVYTLLCPWSAYLCKAFGLSNLCYSKISVVKLLGYRIAGITRKFESEQNKICPAL